MKRIVTACALALCVATVGIQTAIAGSVAARSAKPAMFVSSGGAVDAETGAVVAVSSSNTTSSTVTDGKDTSYQVGPGDVIYISVYLADELTKRVRVDSDGSISMPLINEIHVEGKNILEIEREIANRLRQKYIKDPQVSAFIGDFRAQKISVVGEVFRPNNFTIREPQSVTQVLALAGGIKESAGSNVVVERDRVGGGRETIVMDIQRLLDGTSEYKDLMLKDGDSLRVPAAGVFFVEGAVKNPGLYTLKGNVNILRALAMAGGLDPAADSDDIRLFQEEGNSDGLAVDIDDIRRDPSRDIVVSDGDIVVVGESFIKQVASGLWSGFGRIFSLNRSF